MASSSKVGDLIWAKMKGFPAWPGKIIEPKTDVKKNTKKNQHFVFFFGSENYAWIHEDNIWPYLDFKSRFLLTTRIPRGFKEAVEAIEDCVKSLPKQTSYKVSDLPSIEEELSQIFPSRSPHKDKDTQSNKKRKSSAQSDPDYKSKAAIPKERRSSASKRKSEKINKEKLEEKNKKAVQDDQKFKTPPDGVAQTTSNGRPARRSSRSASAASSHQPAVEEQVDLETSGELVGKHVVPYEEWVASEENVTQAEVHKMEVDNDDIPDSQMSNQDIFAGDDDMAVNFSDNNVTGVSESTEQINSDDREHHTDLDGGFDNKNVDKSENNTLVESNEQQGNNIFEKMNFGSVLIEPSAEEMFDEMIRSSTPSATEKSNQETKSQPSDDTTVESSLLSSETEESEKEKLEQANTESEPISPLKMTSADLKSKTPTITLTGKKLTPKRSTSPANTPAPKKSRILEKATPKATVTPKQYVKPAVAASSSDSKPVAGISADAMPAVGEAPPKTIIATPAKIGFLGLGIMGQGMVTNLLKSGHEVTVWNRTASKCREFVKEGALKGNSPAEVVAQCDITFSCVSDPTALKDLVFGNCGVLQGIGSKKSYVDMSTVDVETVIDIHDAVIARGGRFLEAPVIGSKAPAQNGELVILSAGDLSLHEDCFSCFQAIGKKTLYLGDIGNAARMKLVVNMLIGTVAAGLAESMALAEKIGLDQAELLRVLMLSDVASSLVETKGTAIMNSKFETNFPLQHQQKDLRLAIDMADSVDQPMYVISAANEALKDYSRHSKATIQKGQGEGLWRA